MSQPINYQWQSTDWQLPEFLTRQNVSLQPTVTREVPPMPHPGFNPMVRQMPSGTAGMTPMAISNSGGIMGGCANKDASTGRIAGTGETGKNISITLNLNLGGTEESDEGMLINQPEDEYQRLGYRESAPSWYQ